MIKDFAASDHRAAKLIGREMLAGVSTVLLYPFGMGKSKRRTARTSEQRTTVFIHGYLANPSCFLPLSLYMRAHGHHPTMSYNYPSSMGIEQAAIGLRDFLRRHVRGGRVDLVCHSMGGLVARVYLQELGGARRVDSCVTLGTPHRGTYNAYWLWSRVGKELRPDSKLLARLEESKDEAKNVRFLSIIAGSDNMVIPRVFGQGSEEILHVPHLGHMGLLYSPIVFQKVLTHLNE